MEKCKTYQLIIAVLFVALFASCTKSEMRTNKFMKQGRWKVTALTIGGSEVTLLPIWDIQESTDVKEFAPGIWTHYNGTQAQFLWRFDYYEGTFSFQTDYTIEQDPMTKAFIQCSNLAGSYMVLTEKSKLFEFESTETNGYSGVPVFIKLQPM